MEEFIRRAVDEFHKRFYPEARVEFLGMSNDGKLAFLFSGHMCLTCGMSDYFVDFMEILSESAGIPFDIEDMKELTDEGDAWVVVYAPTKKHREDKLRRVILFDVKAPGKVVKVEEYEL